MTTYSANTTLGNPGLYTQSSVNTDAMQSFSWGGGHSLYTSTSGADGIFAEITGGGYHSAILAQNYTSVGNAIYAISNANVTGAASIIGINTSAGIGIYGQNTSNNNAAVVGFNTSTGYAIEGVSTSGHGIKGTSNDTTGNYYGLSGVAESGRAGVYGYSNSSATGSGIGVYAYGRNYGVYGVMTSNAGIAAVYGEAISGGAALAGKFAGNVTISGNLTVTGSVSKGSGTFTVDHPVDPENKFLAHSFVESPDMMNIYDGIINTDSSGFATIKMPSYFESLNKEFRYQLTAIGCASPNMYVSQELTNGSFEISDAAPNSKVSWQVTGKRCDKYAVANPIEVEREKTKEERGLFLHPHLFGHGSSHSLHERTMTA